VETRTNYGDFLKNKKIISESVGFKADVINPCLYDFQSAITKWALLKGRCGIFADCGLGKTLMQLEWARHVHNHTGKPILILAPLAVSLQTQREGKKFNVNVNICSSQSDVSNGINVTNYEKLHKFDTSNFIGVVLDESSILKDFTGKFRNFIIDEFKYTPYKLACTATPAPNDFVELGNHAEFLNVLTRPEMLSMFFINDASNTGTWRLKGHSQKEFWQWMCSWSIMLSSPSDIGFKNNGFNLPPLNIIEKTIKMGIPLPGNLFVEPANTLSERRLARKISIEKKVNAIKNIINENQFIVWCDLNKESESISSSISGMVEITGSDKSEKKEQAMIDFSEGKIKYLVTKPKIAGHGMNFQNCHEMAFMGLSDSYESFYQAVRRCWRFGQKHPVNAYVIVSDLETNVVENVKRKESDALMMRTEMVKNMHSISTLEINSAQSKLNDYKTEHKSGNNWEIYLGDNVEIIKNIESESIGLSIFSPPFAQLFTYSDSHRDMGNCRNKDEFFKHFDYLIGDLYRVLMPGRLAAIHCMNLPATISHDGFIGIRDFRGDIIRQFESKGFIFHSEVCIWKDPLIQAVRTKQLSLSHKQVVKDSSRCGQGLADYIVCMRKAGDNPKPITRAEGFKEYIGDMKMPKVSFNNDQRKNKLSHMIWQRYASPVWFDISQTRVLSKEIARADRDEKHICPLQLDSIERCIELWSAKGDKILDPFVGIGSVVFCAAKMDRYGIGIELKESYYNQAIKNMNIVKYQKAQMELFG